VREDDKFSPSVFSVGSAFEPGHDIAEKPKLARSAHVEGFVVNRARNDLFARNDLLKVGGFIHLKGVHLGPQVNNGMLQLRESITALPVRADLAQREMRYRSSIIE
jgi:hypothetical protein